MLIYHFLQSCAYTVLMVWWWGWAGQPMACSMFDILWNEQRLDSRMHIHTKLCWHELQYGIHGLRACTCMSELITTDIVTSAIIGQQLSSHVLPALIQQCKYRQVYIYIYIMHLSCSMHHSTVWSQPPDPPGSDLVSYSPNHTSDGRNFARVVEASVWHVFTVLLS